MSLTPRERDILDLEREWFLFEGRKDDVVRERFGMSASAYYRTLQALIDRPDALAYDPLTVRRLRRDRDRRRRLRIEGRRADPGHR